MSTIDRASTEPLTRRRLRELSPELFWGDDYALALEQSLRTEPEPDAEPEPMAEPESDAEPMAEPEPEAEADPEPPRPYIDPLDPFAGWITPETSDTAVASARGRRDPGVVGGPAVNSRAIWWYVALPIIQGIVATGLFAATLFALYPDPSLASVTATTADTSTLALFGGIVVAVSMLGFLAAIRLLRDDRRMLRARGFSRSVSPWWHLLGPVVVLAIRAVTLRAEAPRASRPLVAYVCVYLLAGVALAAVGPALSSIG